MSPLNAFRRHSSRVMLLLALLAALAPADTRAQPAPGAVGARVGLQIGHWRIEELPEDQARLRGQTGGSAAGYHEVDINWAVVHRVAAILVAQGVTVDILPATVPRGYRADAFVAIHCDATPDRSPGPRGYKLARYRDSIIPERDDTLIEMLSQSYGAATRLPLDPNVTRAMTGYYAYNQKRFQTVIDPQTPSTIIELAYLTNPTDRTFLLTEQDLIATALADGILRFLATSGIVLTAAPVVATPPAPLALPVAPATPVMLPAPAAPLPRPAAGIVEDRRDAPPPLPSGLGYLE